MKIKGPGRITTSGVARKGKKRRAGSSGFGATIRPETAVATPVSGTSPLTAVNSLLSLQEMANESEGRAHGLAIADHLMENLDIIRHGLLAGQIPYHKLKDVARLVSRQARQTNDPVLDGILADMELRLRVELAKLEMLGETSGR